MNSQSLDRQTRIYAFIVAYKKSHDGNSPTFREIMEHVGIQSTSLLDFYLDKLEDRGLIHRPVERRKLSIEIVGGAWILGGKNA